MIYEEQDINQNLIHNVLARLQPFLITAKIALLGVLLIIDQLQHLLQVSINMDTDELCVMHNA